MLRDEIADFTERLEGALDTVQNLETDLAEMDELLKIMEDDNEDNERDDDILQLKRNMRDSQLSRDNWTAYSMNINRLVQILTRELLRATGNRIAPIPPGLSNGYH